MKFRSIVLALALLGTAAGAHAQDRTLERVQNLIATGRLTEARNTLAQWEKDNRDPAGTATPDDRARALFLTGVLSSDAKAAEDAFIGVVLSHPYSPVAPEALLRLGQGLHTAGETDRAIAYLERLASDYPSAPQRETAMLWLTRAQLARGDAAAACGTARESLFSTSNENVRTLIELERDRACAESGGVATTPGIRRPGRALSTNAVIVLDDPVPGDSTPVARANSTPITAAPARGAPAVPERAPAAAPLVLPDLAIATDSIPWDSPRDERSARRSDTQTELQRTPEEVQRTPATPSAQPAARVAEPTVDNSAEYAVQTAAFTQRRSAETIAAELRAKGFDARIVTVPGSAHFRVRHGAFRTSREAANAALHIRDAGFATLIVNDVRLERR